MKCKKTLLVIGVLFVVLCSMILAVPSAYADAGITFTVNPATATAKLGDTVSIDLGVADIDQSTTGINAIEGKVVFDSDLFESVSLIGAGNNWSVSYNETESELKGKFVLSNMNGTKESQVVARVIAKLKADATVTSGTITLQDMFSSYGSTPTTKVTKTITVNVGSSDKGEDKDKEDGNIIDPGTSNTSKDDKSSSTTPSTTSSTTKNTPTSKTTSSKASSLPKAGISSWIAIFVVATIIVAIIEFVKYRKITK